MTHDPGGSELSWRLMWSRIHLVANKCTAGSTSAGSQDFTVS